jgi:NAD(P)-dependent dehydrogenase (short-subunit alcohol dehydrogenase family)
MRAFGKLPRTVVIHTSNGSKGGFLFAQQAIPLLLETAKTNPKYPATLLFTGATASIRASIGFSAFASAKWALRALSQSLAKEFGPQGVHVGHIIADGGFDTPIRKQLQPDGDEETWMSTEGMAQSYWSLHVQPKRAWSWEIDLRPYLVTPNLKLLTDRRNGEIARKEFIYINQVGLIALTSPLPARSSLYCCGQIPDFPGIRIPFGSIASFRVSLNFNKAPSFQL